MPISQRALRLGFWCPPNVFMTRLLARVTLQCAEPRGCINSLSCDASAPGPAANCPLQLRNAKKSTCCLHRVGWWQGWHFPCYPLAFIWKVQMGAALSGVRSTLEVFGAPISKPARITRCGESVWGVTACRSWALETHTRQGPGSGPPDQGEVAQTQVLSPAMLLGRRSRRASR